MISEKIYKEEADSKIEEFETDRLILRPGNNQRDNDVFMKMLRQEGDFRVFAGVDLTEKNILMFTDYFESKNFCCYAVFEKKHIDREMIGYVGIGKQKQQIEVEFYLSKLYRNRGYCTEALGRLIKEALAGRLLWNNEDGRKSKLIVDTLYATTIADNLSAVRVLEKCGFIKNPKIIPVFQLFIDPDNSTVYQNDIAEYIFKVPAVTP